MTRDSQQLVASAFRQYGGDSCIVVGRGYGIQRLRSEWVRAVSRHRAYWVLDEIESHGLTTKELRDKTGAGKKKLRRRLWELHAAGLVELRRNPDDPGKNRWFLRSPSSPSEGGVGPR